MSAFTEKNERRKEARATRDFHARDLRRQGVSVQVKTVIPMDDGPDIVQKDLVQGVPGAFGWGTNQEWNERVRGTLGDER
jgi:hypothetical protein